MPRKRTIFLTAAFFLAGCYLLLVDPFIRPPTASAIDHAYLLQEQSLSARPDTHDSSHHRNNATTQILLVSGLFPLEKSKHSMEDYDAWLQRFLQHITTDVYFYTTPALAQLVYNARGRGLPITVDTSYVSPFDVPPLRGLQEKYAAMHDKDREKDLHSPELYAVWNGKSFLLENAVKMLAEQGQKYEYAFWNDAGSFRGEHRYQEWPDGKRVEQIWEEGSRLAGTKKEDLFFFPTAGMLNMTFRSWAEEDGPIDFDFFEGSFFGGPPRAIRWWSQTIYAYHDYYLNEGFFVGKDQSLFNALALLFPERFLTVWVKYPYAPARKGRLLGLDHNHLGLCGSEWYYYQFWLADRQTREGMRDVWSGSMDGWRQQGAWAEKMSSWEWWRKRQACRLTVVLPLREALTRNFGQRWRPPKHSNLVNTL